MTAKTKWVGLGGLTLLFFLGLYITLIWPAHKRYNRSYAEFSQKITALRSFLARPGGPPSDKEDSRLAAEIKILEERHHDLETAFIPQRKEIAAATPVEFGDVLDRTKKELLDRAKKSGLKIPSDLGFKETIPSQEEVKTMAKQLEAVTFLIKEDLSLGAADIKGIRYLGLEAEGPWEKVGLELSLHGQFGQIVEFLYHLSHGNKIYVFKSLEIRKGEEAVAVAPKLKAGLALPMAEVKKEEKREVKISAEHVSAIVSLEAYIYIAEHGN